MKEDIAVSPLFIFDLGKHLCRKFATTSSHLDKLFGGKDLNHEMTFLASEIRKINISTKCHMIHDLSSCMSIWILMTMLVKLIILN